MGLNTVFKVFLIGRVVTGQFDWSNKWWDRLDYQPSQLTLANGIFNGKVIEVEGNNIEIYRGKNKYVLTDNSVRERVIMGELQLFKICNN